MPKQSETVDLETLKSDVLSTYVTGHASPYSRFATHRTAASSLREMLLAAQDVLARSVERPSKESKVTAPVLQGSNIDQSLHTLPQYFTRLQPCENWAKSTHP